MGQVIVDTPHKMVLPFEFFSYMFYHYPSSFAARFLGSAATSVENAADALRFHMYVACFA